MNAWKGLAREYRRSARILTRAIRMLMTTMGTKKVYARELIREAMVTAAMVDEGRKSPELRVDTRWYDGADLEVFEVWCTEMGVSAESPDRYSAPSPSDAARCWALEDEWALEQIIDGDHQLNATVNVRDRSGVVTCWQVTGRVEPVVEVEPVT